MIIWNGKGYLVLVIVFLCSLLTELVVEYFTNDDTFYQTSPIPLAAMFLGSGLIIWTIGRNSKRNGKRVLLDKETGEEVELNKKDHLFFIPMEYWGVILVLLSFGNIIFKL